MNKIITIGREFGSGGRELGRRLAEELGIAYYDREIIAEIAKRTELSEQYVQQIVEHRPLNLMPITIGHSICPVPHPLMEQNQEIYRQQAQILTEMSQKSDCVLVGRCADYILKDKNPLKIFVYADMASKIARCRLKAPENEHLSDHEMRKQIKRSNSTTSPGRRPGRPGPSCSVLPTSTMPSPPIRNSSSPQTRIWSSRRS